MARCGRPRRTLASFGLSSGISGMENPWGKEGRVEVHPASMQQHTAQLFNSDC